MDNALHAEAPSAAAAAAAAAVPRPVPREYYFPETPGRVEVALALACAAASPGPHMHRLRNAMLLARLVAGVRSATDRAPWGEAAAGTPAVPTAPPACTRAVVDLSYMGLAHPFPAAPPAAAVSVSAATAAAPRGGVEAKRATGAALHGAARDRSAGAVVVGPSRPALQDPATGVGVDVPHGGHWALKPASLEALLAHLAHTKAGTGTGTGAGTGAGAGAGAGAGPGVDAAAGGGATGSPGVAGAVEAAKSAGAVAATAAPLPAPGYRRVGDGGWAPVAGRLVPGSLHAFGDKDLDGRAVSVLVPVHDEPTAPTFAPVDTVAPAAGGGSDPPGNTAAVAGSPLRWFRKEQPAPMLGGHHHAHVEAPAVGPGGQHSRGAGASAGDPVGPVISGLPVARLQEVAVLCLAGNPCVRTWPPSLAHAVSLWRLDLSHCGLTAFPSRALAARWPLLAYLNLSHNAIEVRRRRVGRRPPAPPNSLLTQPLALPPSHPPTPTPTHPLKRAHSRTSSPQPNPPSWCMCACVRACVHGVYGGARRTCGWRARRQCWPVCATWT